MVHDEGGEYDYRTNFLRGAIFLYALSFTGGVVLLAPSDC